MRIRFSSEGAEFSLFTGRGVDVKFFHKLLNSTFN